MSLYNLTRINETWNNSTFEWTIRINCNNENGNRESYKSYRFSIRNFRDLEF